MKKTLLIIGLLFFTGCIDHYAWYKSETSLEQAICDYNDCDPPVSTWLGKVRPRERALVIQCMEAKGYKYVDVGWHKEIKRFSVLPSYREVTGE
jgi:hypothetical protein